MRWLTLVLLVSLLCGACAAPARHPRDLPMAAASAAFTAADQITVTVIDPEPIDQVELIAPDGTSYRATDIRRAPLQDADAGLKPQIGLVGGGGPRSGSDVGIGIALPIFGTGDREGTLRSTASVVIPDMGTYRTTWRLWQIRVRLGKPEQGAAYATIAAPEPPQR